MKSRLTSTIALSSVFALSLVTGFTHMARAGGDVDDKNKNAGAAVVANFEQNSPKNTDPTRVGAQATVEASGESIHWPIDGQSSNVPYVFQPSIVRYKIGASAGGITDGKGNSLFVGKAGAQGEASLEGALLGTVGYTIDAAPQLYQQTLIGTEGVKIGGSRDGVAAWAGVNVSPINLIVDRPNGAVGFGTQFGFTGEQRLGNLSFEEAVGLGLVYGLNASANTSSKDVSDTQTVVTLLQQGSRQAGVGTSLSSSVGIKYHAKPFNIVANYGYSGISYRSDKTNAGNNVIAGSTQDVKTAGTTVTVGLAADF